MVRSLADRTFQLRSGPFGAAPRGRGNHGFLALFGSGVYVWMCSCLWTCTCFRTSPSVSVSVCVTVFVIVVLVDIVLMLTVRVLFPSSRPPCVPGPGSVYYCRPGSWGTCSSDPCRSLPTFVGWVRPGFVRVPSSEVRCGVFVHRYRKRVRGRDPIRYRSSYPFTVTFPGSSSWLPPLPRPVSLLRRSLHRVSCLLSPYLPRVTNYISFHCSP